MDVVRALERANDSDRAARFWERNGSLGLDVELLLEADPERALNNLHILQIFQILQNLAFANLDAAKEFGGLVQVKDRRGSVVLDPDMAGGLLECSAVGGRQEQNGLLPVPDLSVFPSQDGLIVSDELHDIFPRDVVRCHNRHPAPFKGRIERDGPDPALRDGRADGLAVQRVRDGEVVGVAGAPGDLVAPLPPRDGASDGHSRVTHATKCVVAILATPHAARHAAC